MLAPATAIEAHSRAALARAIHGYEVSQAVCVAAALGIPDLLRSATRSVPELAMRTGTNAAALRRLMRALAAAGLFRESETGDFALTDIGLGLCEGADATLAPIARLFGSSPNWSAWGALLHSVRTGETAFEYVHGCDVWAYRAVHPRHGDVFDRAMAGLTKQHAASVLKVLDFSGLDHIVDVGGGDGTFLSSILAACPGSRGTLFDQPNVTAQAVSSLAAQGVADRCNILEGDFFTSLPEGADAYLLKWILHDWDDEKCVTILRAVRRACSPNGRLLVFEHIVEPPNTGLEGKLLDLMMLVMTGGRERSIHEYARLLSAAGFDIVKVTPTASLLSVIEAKATPSLMFDVAPSHGAEPVPAAPSGAAMLD